MSAAGQRRRADRQAGFSVLEALVSLALFLIVLTAVLSTYDPGRRIYVRGQHLTAVQQNARLAMAEMARQIRLAGYFPEDHVVPEPPATHGEPIRVATDEALAIYGDADGSGVSRVVLFCRDGDVLRRTSGPVDAEASYACEAGEIVAEHVADLGFVYYDAVGEPVPDPPAGPFRLDGQAPGAVPAIDDTTQRSSVRRVLVALTTESDVPGRGTQRYTLTSNVWLRNLP